jgi:hypothetical protein
MKALIALVVVLVLLIGWAAVVEERKWRDFAAAHGCRVVGKRQGDTTVGYTSAGGGGTVIGSSSPQVAYLCDDGVTYWRNE